jgi:hypothetical protein
VGTDKSAEARPGRNRFLAVELIVCYDTCQIEQKEKDRNEPLFVVGLCVVVALALGSL